LAKFPYNDITTPEDYKRIVSKAIEQRVKVASKNWTARSSPLKESTTIDYTPKIVRNKSKNKLKFLNINDIDDFTAYIYPHKLIKINNTISLINDDDELEILSNIFCCNITMLNVLYCNQEKNDFNSLISCYLYYLLNIFYISLPHTTSDKLKQKRLSLKKSEVLFMNLIDIITNNNNNNKFGNFIDCINNFSKSASIIKRNTVSMKNKELKNIHSYRSLLDIPEKLKLDVISYLTHYVLSPKNKFFTLTYNPRKIKIICLIFNPLISYATNDLNIQYLKHYRGFSNYKKEITHPKKMSVKRICNNYMNNDNGDDKTHLKKAITFIHSHLNRKIIELSSNKIKSYYDNNIHRKINFILPELSKNDTFNFYKQLIMNSYITYSSLRQRKNCASKNNKNFKYAYNEEQNDYFFIKYMDIKKCDGKF